MNWEQIQKTEAFLEKTFADSPFLQSHPDLRAYRLEHSYRVANLGRQIAEAEGFDATAMVIACLLHDISYCQELADSQAWREHGHISASMARPFLEQLGLPGEQVGDILYGIAIHVDDTADFEWRRTPFAETIGDADNIDRFDVYRIYENLEYKSFSKKSLPEKQEMVQQSRERLKKLRDMKLATGTAEVLWRQRVEYYLSFYEKLELQLKNSAGIL